MRDFQISATYFQRFSMTDMYKGYGAKNFVLN